MKTQNILETLFSAQYTILYEQGDIFLISTLAEHTSERPSLVGDSPSWILLVIV